MLKIRTYSFLAVWLPFCACIGRDHSGEPMTVPVTRGDFTASVQSKGVIEARRSYTMVVPRLWRVSQLEVSYLPLEGAFVRQGEVVVEFSGDLQQAELNLARRRLELARADVDGTLAEQSSRRSQLEAGIRQAEASAESARLQLARLEFVAPRERRIKELEIEQSRIQAEKSRRKLSSLVKVQKEELNQKHLQVKQAQGEVDMLQRNLDLLTLRAPVDGYVQYLTNEMTDNKVQQGDKLHPGMAVVSIPDLSGLQVKLQLSETAVQSLKEGQRTEVVIPTLGDLKLPGRLAQVAKVAKPVRRNSKVKTVEVLVDLIDSLRVDGLVPGLTASCRIVTREVHSAVILSLDALFEKDSLPVVYVRSGDSFRPCRIFIGPRDDNFAVVDSGLKGNEQVALREPDRKLLE